MMCQVCQLFCTTSVSLTSQTQGKTVSHPFLLLDVLPMLPHTELALTPFLLLSWVRVKVASELREVVQIQQAHIQQLSQTRLGAASEPNQLGLQAPDSRIASLFQQQTSDIEQVKRQMQLLREEMSTEGAGGSSDARALLQDVEHQSWETRLAASQARLLEAEARHEAQLSEQVHKHHLLFD